MILLNECWSREQRRLATERRHEIAARGLWLLLCAAIALAVGFAIGSIVYAWKIGPYP